MSLEQMNQVDAIGLDRETGHAVLTIVDSWNWDDELSHLLALQEKLNAYLEFIASGQVRESYLPGEGRQLRINVVFRFAPPDAATGLLSIAAEVASDLDVLVSHEVV